MEYFSLAYLYCNQFFLSHIVFISHVFAAVVLVFTEYTVNARIIGPIMNFIEGMFDIPLLPNLVTTLLFLLWITLSLYIYQYLIKLLLLKYQDHITLVLAVFLVISAIGINVNYRD